MRSPVLEPRARVGAVAASSVGSSSSGRDTGRFYWRNANDTEIDCHESCRSGHAAALLLAQGRSPSPSGTAATQVGGKYVAGGEAPQYQNGKWIEITYGRPIKRGRDSMGLRRGLRAHAQRRAPVWRAGANVSTRLKTEAPLVINGKTVPAGEYSLFIDLKPSNWTLICLAGPASQTFPGTKDALFGAFDYTPDKDVVRSPMKLDTRCRSRSISSPGASWTCPRTPAGWRSCGTRSWRRWRSPSRSSAGFSRPYQATCRLKPDATSSSVSSYAICRLAFAPPHCGFALTM